MRWIPFIPTLMVALLGLGSPGAARAGEVSFDGSPLSGALAASVAADAGDELIAFRGCRGPGAAQAIDGCMVLVVGDGETRSAVMIADASCQGGPGCYAGHPVIARADGFEPSVADTTLDLFVRIHGGIATSPLGLAQPDPSATALELHVRVHGGLASSPLGIDGGPVDEKSVVQVCGGLGSSPLGGIVANPDETPLSLEICGGLGSCPFGTSDLAADIAEIVAQQVCGGLGSCPLGIADLPRAFVTTNAWLGSLGAP